MDKYNFTFKDSPCGSGTYIVETEGFKVEISETYFSDEKNIVCGKVDNNLLKKTF